MTSTAGHSPLRWQIAQTFDFVAGHLELGNCVCCLILPFILGFSYGFDIQPFLCSFVPCSAETKFH
jgi:hypothetical protein